MTLFQARGILAAKSKKKFLTIADRVAMRVAAQVVRYSIRRKYRNNPAPTLDQAVQARLSEIADIAESGVTEMTGKLRRGGDRDDVVGRFGGMKPSYPELNKLSAGPKEIARSIRKGKGLAYRRIYAVVEAALEQRGFQRARKKTRGRLSVAPHEPLRKCKHCGHLHTKSEHRFHGPGAFHNTHLWGFNPPLKVIYGQVLRIEAKKTQKHVCDADCRRCDHSYVHDFKPGAVMYGLPNGDILIRSK